jgi:hypothetical protein
MLWSKRESRIFRSSNTSSPSPTSQKASSSGGSAEHRINQSDTSFIASAANLGFPRLPLTPLDPQSTLPSASQSQITSFHSTSSSASSSHSYILANSEMAAIDFGIGRQIITDRLDELPLQPAKRRSTITQ